MEFDINKLIITQIYNTVTPAVHGTSPKFATVVGIGGNGTVILRFDGEKSPSKKQYQRLSGYSPTIGDRVLLQYHSGTVLVIDRIIGVPEAFPLPEPDPPTVIDIELEFSGDFHKISLEKNLFLPVTALEEASKISIMSNGNTTTKLSDTFIQLPINLGLCINEIIENLQQIDIQTE